MMHFRRKGTWPGGSRETIREFNLLSNGAVESFWDTLWLGIQAFFVFYGRIPYNLAPMPPSDREFNLLSNGAVESFWDTL